MTPERIAWLARDAHEWGAISDIEEAICTAVAEARAEAYRDAARACAEYGRQYAYARVASEQCVAAIERAAEAAKDRA